MWEIRHAAHEMPKPGSVLRIMLLLVVFMSFLAVKVVPCFLDKAWVSHIPPLGLLALDSLSAYQILGTLMDLQRCPKTCCTAGGAATCESEKPGKCGAWIVVGACLKLKAPIFEYDLDEKSEGEPPCTDFPALFFVGNDCGLHAREPGLMRQCWGCVILALGMVEFLREFGLDFFGQLTSYEGSSFPFTSL